MLRTDVVRHFDEQLVKEILCMKSAVYPREWEYADAAEYYSEVLIRGECINIFLKDGDKIIGYLLAIPHNIAVRDLKEYYPKMKEDDSRYYIDTTIILPEYQKGRGLIKLLHAVISEAENRFGVNRFSMHARVNNGLSGAIQRYYKGMITKVRRIKAWAHYNYKEPADYIEATYNGIAEKVYRGVIKTSIRDYEDIYTPLEEARDEILRRCANPALKEKVANYVGEVPEIFMQQPVAYLFRSLISPHNEYELFCDLAGKINFKPVVGEYLDDKFINDNRDKFSLAKMAFFKGWDKKGRPIIRYKMVVNTNFSLGKRCREIETLWRENFVDFHHRLFSFSPIQPEIFDQSPFFRRHGGGAVEYYPKFLALSVCHSVLFDDYVVGEEVFFQSVVLPSFQKVSKLFGVKPLIVSLLAHKGDRFFIDGAWPHYSEEIEKEVLRCLSACSPSIP